MAPSQELGACIVDTASCSIAPRTSGFRVTRGEFTIHFKQKLAFFIVGVVTALIVQSGGFLAGSAAAQDDTLAPWTEEQFEAWHRQFSDSRDAAAGADWSQIDFTKYRTTWKEDTMGVHLWRAYLQRVNLEGANLRYANANSTNLIKANLRGAVFSQAYIGSANLRSADLRDADLRESSLTGTSFQRADLTGGDLRGANLARADLRDTDLSSTTLTGAHYDAETRFPEGFDPGAAGMLLRE